MAKDFSSVKRLITLSRDSLRESLFRNVGVPYRNFIGLILGATASLLPLTSGTWTIEAVIWVFVIALGITMLLLVGVRPNVEKELDQFAWGLLVIIILGFGLGALIYRTRSWWIWLWHQYLRINNTGAILLEALFLLGVILGFFVVRNWAKEQKDFVASLSAVLSGSFVATILGKLLEGNTPSISPMRAFAYYALGFTMSGALNLIAAARLTANYVNKRSLTSRAILDFLYGSERAELIDKYFLKNFRDDPDYAKSLLTETMLNYRELVAREYAERMEERRIDRKRNRISYEVKNGKISDMAKEKQALEPACSELNANQEERNKLQDAIDALESLPGPSAKQNKMLQVMQTQLTALDLEIANLSKKCHTADLEKWEKLEHDLNELKPSYYYELMAIEMDDEQTEAEAKTLPGGEADREHLIMYRKIEGAAGEENEHPKPGPPIGAITERMFRVGISARWQDTLEYITAPGEYRMPFKFTGSVAGLALLFRKTIVMDRDKQKKFRNAEFADGITPGKVKQSRGLDEIDFLSYVAIPIVSRLGAPGENPVGIMTIDTKIFVTRSELGGEPVPGTDRVLRTRLRKSELTEFGSHLYDQEDKCVEYIERLTKVITPVLELYSKCRIGAT